MNPQTTSRSQVRPLSRSSQHALLYRVRRTYRANRLIYWTGRIPLLGRLIPDRVYRFQGKAGLLAAIDVVRALYALICCMLYYCLFFFGPYVSGVSFTHQSVFLSLIGGGLFVNALQVTGDKGEVYILRDLQIDPEFYYRDVFLRKYVGFLLKNTAAILLTGALAAMLRQLGLSQLIRQAPGPLIWLPLLFGSVGLRIGMDAWMLRKFKRDGNLNHKAYTITIAALLISAGAIVCPILLSKDDSLRHKLPPIPDLPFISFAACIAGLLIALLSIRYLHAQKKWHAIARYQIHQASELTVQKTTQNQMLKSFGLTDGALNMHVPEQLDNRKGYEYLHALYFFRFAKKFRRSFLIRIAFAAAGVATLCLIRYLAPLHADEVIKLREAFSNPGILLYALFLLLLRDPFNLGLFVNIDRWLLSYGFYRRPADLLRSFRIRLRILLLRFNLPIALIVVIGQTLMASDPLQLIESACITLAFTLFLSILSLALYYLLQPYSAELENKSPFYSIINTIMIMVSYTLAFRGGIPLSAGPYFLAATPVLTALVLLLLYRLSPKTFHLRS